MSHLHRQLAANAAIAADKNTTHPCTPTVIHAEPDLNHIANGRPHPRPRAKKKAKARRRG